MGGKPKAIFLEVVTEKVYNAIIDYFVHNNAEGIKWKFLGYCLKDQVAHHMEKSIKETILYSVDGPDILEDQNLIYFGFWVKIRPKIEFSTSSY